MSIEAMKTALEALQHASWNNDCEMFAGAEADRKLRTAIEEAERDMPKIGCVNHDCDQCKAAAPINSTTSMSSTYEAPVIDKSAAIRIATSLGWTPPEAPVQEPVDDLLAEITKLWGVISEQQQQLAAQRQLVGLTDEDFDALFLNEDGVRFARYIEAKLKEKNHG